MGLMKNANQTLDDCIKLSVSNYKQQLREKPNAAGVTVTCGMSDGTTTQHEIAVTTTKPNYGGVRYWWECPQCNKRAAVLYFKNGYKCRHCADLPYRTQNKTALDRALIRVEAIRKALGWQAGIINGHGSKPRGMWESTFKTLVYEHDRQAEQLINEIKKGL